MATSRINNSARRLNDTGFSTDNRNHGGRFLLKNGEPNVHYHGISFLERFSFYHVLMRMKWTSFLLVLVMLFLVLNVGFALIYYILGTEGIAGQDAFTNNDDFWKAFFFSTQTLTTVGYGHFSPDSFGVNLVAAAEALTGWLCFALATGLMYGRFSRPRMHLRFSDKAVVAPFQNGLGLMVKVAPFKENHHLIDAEALMTLSLVRDNNGEKKTEFYRLDLEYSRVNTLTLSWTIVHPINESSPLYGLSDAQFKEMQPELLVFLKAFDDSFNSQVTSRSSYTGSEILFGYRFPSIFHRDKKGGSTILEVNRLNNVVPVSPEEIKS